MSSEFKEITIKTQEEFDGHIKERLERHEKQIREEVTAKYADYEELKQNSADFSEKEKVWTDEKAGYETKLAEAGAKLKVFEKESMKAAAIKTAGIPADAWDEAGKLIHGETEDELKQSAEALKSLIGSGERKKTPPKKDPELGGEDQDEFAQLSKSLGKGE